MSRIKDLYQRQYEEKENQEVVIIKQVIKLDGYNIPDEQRVRLSK